MIRPGESLHRRKTGKAAVGLAGSSRIAVGTVRRWRFWAQLRKRHEAIDPASALRIEEALACGRDEQGRTPADILRERRKRRLEANGEPYVEPRPLPPGLRGASLVEILRYRYRERRQTR